MPEVTLQAIEDMMDNMLDKKLEPIKAILSNHTMVLAQFVPKDKIKKDNKKVENHRLDRLEDWGLKVGRQVGINLDL
jgi:hypothetical protein